MQLLFRFVVGGFIVSLFTEIGDILKPKSFAGLFGAAPSVALATLGLALFANGKLYVAREARSMIAGAFALFVYCSMTIWLIMKYKFRASSAAIAAIAVWLVCALGAWVMSLR